ncbi:MAG: glycosyltransferase [Bacteroidales bacterium]
MIDSLTSGGAQRQLVNLAIGFKNKGHEVCFLVYHRINFFKTILDRHDIPVYEVIRSNYILRFFKMRAFIRRGKFDGVLSFLEASNFICQLSGLPGRKWSLVVGERSANPLIFSSLKKRIYRWFHGLADYVVANSHKNLKIVRQVNPFLPKSKCRVIYNIIEFDKLRPLDVQSKASADVFRLLVIASHRYLKNLNGLIEAVKVLPSEDQQKLQVHWFGDSTIDNSKSKAERKIEEYDLWHIFHFHEPKPEIREEMKKADAVGLFSFHEGLPNVICEAMALSKPVIAPAVSDIPMLIKNPRLTFNPQNHKEISRSLSSLINMTEEERNSEGQTNRERALSLFNNEENIENYLALLSPV